MKTIAIFRSRKPPLKLIALFTSLSLALSISSHARLGENYEQLVARYGQPEKPFENVYVWKFNGVSVRVLLENGKCIGENYSRIDGFPFTRTQIADLLIANGDGKAWKAAQGNPTDAYDREDGKAYASSEERGREFMVMVIDQAKLDAAIAPVAPIHLKGF